MSDVVTIPLSDPRLPQAVATLTTATAAIPVTAETAALPAMPCRQDGNQMFFQVGVMKNGTAHEVGVLIEGGNLVFFPARSGLQRELMTTLGIGDS